MHRLPLLLAVSTVLLTGCALENTATPSPATGTVALTGRVHGGQQPVAGAHVHIFQASNMGNSFDDGRAASAAATPSDALGHYVTTDANGNFSITGDYGCAGYGPVYLLATQGNPGLAAGSNNPALALLAVVADACPYENVLPSSLQIDIDEVTTVAGAYALSGYMTAPNSLSYSGSFLIVPEGLTHAADTAMSLVTLANGAVLSKTAAGGTVPTAAISTLANIIASCVNTNGSTAPVTANGVTTTPPCGTLFGNATSNGTSTGIVPPDTVTAILNIAHNTGALARNSAAMSALYDLQTPTAPYIGLPAQPNDFSLALTFSGGGLNSPGIPAVDADGNVWFPNAITGTGFTAATATELSPLGAPSSTSPDTVTLSSVPATMVAVDQNNIPWFSFPANGFVAKNVNQGTTLNAFTYNGASNDDGHQIAIDTSGNVFVSDYTNGALYELSSSGSVISSLSPFFPNQFLNVALFDATHVVDLYYDEANNLNFENTTPLSSSAGSLGNDTVCGNTLDTPSSFAVDVSSQIWALNHNDSLSGCNSTSQNALANSPFTGGGLNTTTLGTRQPHPWLAIDGANHIWVANYTGGLSQFSNTGATLSPNFTSATQPGGLFGSTPTCKGQGLAIDGSGNIWVSCDSTTAPVLEYIGLATPVKTPLLPGNFGQHP